MGDVALWATGLHATSYQNTISKWAEVQKECPT